MRALLAGILVLALSGCVRVNVRVSPPDTVVEEVEDDEDEDDNDRRRLHWWTLIAVAAGAVAGWLARED